MPKCLVYHALVIVLVSSAPGWLRRKQGLRRPGRQRPGLFGSVVSDFIKYLIFDQKRRVVFSIVLVIFSTSVCTHSRPRAKLSTRHSYEFRLKAISVNVLHMDGSRLRCAAVTCVSTQRNKEMTATLPAEFLSSHYADSEALDPSSAHASKNTSAETTANSTLLTLRTVLSVCYICVNIYTHTHMHAYDADCPARARSTL